MTSPTLRPARTPLMRSISLVVGSILVAGVVAAGLISLVWTPYDPDRVIAAQRLQPPSRAHLLGTDALGIDITSRLMVGAQICLLVGVVATAIGAVLGVPLGVVSGMTHRWWGRAVVRITDVLYAFPALLLAIVLAAALGASTLTGMIAIGVASVPVFTRVTRAATMQVMTQDYVAAARVGGASWISIAVGHVVRNIAPVLGVQVSVTFAMAILAEAALSYLGLATPPTVPTWGRMLYDAQTYLFVAPRLAIWPGLAIAGAVLGFNLLGDGLRDHLDPRLREVS